MNKIFIVGSINTDFVISAPYMPKGGETLLGGGFFTARAEGCALLSFLTYEHGLDLKNTLKNRYDAAEQQRRTQELTQRAEQLELLKQKLSRSEISAEEHILALEKQIKLMQADQAKIEPMRKEIFELKEHEEELNVQISELYLNMKKLNNELDEIDLRHAKG